MRLYACPLKPGLRCSATIKIGAESHCLGCTVCMYSKEGHSCNTGRDYFEKEGGGHSKSTGRDYDHRIHRKPRVFREGSSATLAVTKGGHPLKGTLATLAVTKTVTPTGGLRRDF